MSKCEVDKKIRISVSIDREFDDKMSRRCINKSKFINNLIEKFIDNQKLIDLFLNNR